MKSCPTCNRTFEDKFSFCLIDGAILSAPFDPEATQSLPANQGMTPPPTEVLISAHQSSQPRPSNLTPLSQQESNQEVLMPASLLRMKFRRFRRTLIWVGLCFVTILALFSFLKLKTDNVSPVRPEQDMQSGVLNTFQLDIIGKPTVDPQERTLSIDFRAYRMPERIIADMQQNMRVTVNNEEAVINFKSVGKDGFSYNAKAYLEDKLNTYITGKSYQQVSVESHFRYGTRDIIVEKVLELNPLAVIGRQTKVDFKELGTVTRSGKSKT